MKHTNPDGYSREEINLAFEYFVELAQEVSDKYMSYASYPYPATF